MPVLKKCCTIAPVEVKRPVTYDSMQASYFGDDTVPWVLGDDILHPTLWAYDDSFSAQGGSFHSRKMRPFRFKAGALSDLIARNHLERRDIDGVFYAEEIAQADSHIWPVELTEIALPIPFVFGNVSGDEQIYAYRIWIDGNDVTGVVELSPARVLDVTPSSDWIGKSGPPAPLVHEFSAPVSVASAATLEYDLWLEMQRMPTQSGVSSIHFNALVVFTSNYRQDYFLPSYFATNWLAIAKHGDANANKGSDYKYRVTFGGGAVDTPGSVASITLEEQANWTFTKAAASHRVTENATGDFVELNWSHEQAYVVGFVGHTATHGTSLRRWLVTDTGQYPQLTVGPTTYDTGGVWDPAAGSTTFDNPGEFLPSPPRWDMDLGAASPSAQYPMPASVTVDNVGTH